MSSGFVPGGTIENPVERDDEWRRVQQELEETRRRKAEISSQGAGKSLYEVLQQNKMAQQEAFEEQFKLKNQFRALDEDEVEFLDSIMESTRAKEAAVKRETAEQLEAFRQHKEEAERILLEDAVTGIGPHIEGEDWKIPARKRRRDKGGDLLIQAKKHKSSPDIGIISRPLEKELNDIPAGRNKVAVSRSAASSHRPEDDIKPGDLKGSEKPLDNSSGTDSAQLKPKEDRKPVSVSLGLANYDSDSE